MKNKILCLTAVFTAIAFVITRFIQIPLPLGYFNIGNSIILLACCIVPSPYGIFIGSVGSAIADLTSYPIFTIPTLIIKALMPLVFYAFYKKKSTRKNAIIGTAVSTIIPLVGYSVTAGAIYGSVYMGLVQVPIYAAEYALNLVIFIALLSPVMKLKRYSGLNEIH